MLFQEVNKHSRDLDKLTELSLRVKKNDKNGN